MENLKRYSARLKKDNNGVEVPTMVVRQKGRWIEFSELEVALHSASDNTTKSEIFLVKNKLDALICGWVSLNNNERFTAVQDSVAKLSDLC